MTLAYPPRRVLREEEEEQRDKRGENSKDEKKGQGSRVLETQKKESDILFGFFVSFLFLRVGSPVRCFIRPRTVGVRIRNPSGVTCQFQTLVNQ